MKKVKKDKRYHLKKPNIFKMTYKTIIYNLVLSVFLFTLFGLLYTIDDVCYYLDCITMYYFEIEMIPCLLISWFAFRQFFKDLNLIIHFFLSLDYIEKIKRLGCKQCYEGVEGTGKTFTASYTLLMTACEKDRALRLAYYTKYPFKEKLENDADFNAIKSSVEYYESHPELIPHLMSNYKLIYDKRVNYPFSMEYIDQTKRLAESFAIGITEMANEFPNAYSKLPKDEKDDVYHIKEKSEIFSLSRQYFDASFIVDEQRTGEIMLPFRSVISSNRVLSERKHVLEAKFLKILLGHLENVILKKEEKTTPFLSKAKSFLKTLSEDIGFYKFTYNDKESIKDVIKEKELTYVIPCDIPYTYDTRGQRVNYKLYKHKPE